MCNTAWLGMTHMAVLICEVEAVCQTRATNYWFPLLVAKRSLHAWGAGKNMTTSMSKVAGRNLTAAWGMIFW
ncbi:hypothetical protein M440DRAFT_365356 [Trichoderma longibrachiatum ATCC 18648]|uniref:Secreted protein n=1 Tax=Trichoderma longibrachiatum ATCC 18648 TaxID=983965 RepID=A0A2T4BW08_TRILO|nr:hypothetical protein M440DRAFT_365356 [Trichoderma longibrachiatum ATCC 18648]